ncbi:unnamed protein product [Nippostrongylus brasiliensis]|uniref:Uncharacterized protein n=1 Tax=Nippostrongylus brasiliensis TaxID=27835 RepID=A0A0N4XT04_NIPBR|nr:unnamed protein product [Nippostrongylus brasiliensis]
MGGIGGAGIGGAGIGGGGFGEQSGFSQQSSQQSFQSSQNQFQNSGFGGDGILVDRLDISACSVRLARSPVSNERKLS